MHDRNSRSYLVGITSFGSKSCDKVGIYTDGMIVQIYNLINFDIFSFEQYGLDVSRTEKTTVIHTKIGHSECLVEIIK